MQAIAVHTFATYLLLGLGMPGTWIESPTWPARRRSNRALQIFNQLLDKRRLCILLLSYPSHAECSLRAWALSRQGEGFIAHSARTELGWS